MIHIVQADTFMLVQILKQQLNDVLQLKVWGPQADITPQVSPINEEEVISSLAVMLFTYVPGDFWLNVASEGR